MAKSAPVRSTTPQQAAQTVIDLTPSPDASQALTLRDSALGLIVARWWRSRRFTDAGLIGHAC